MYLCKKIYIKNWGGAQTHKLAMTFKGALNFVSLHTLFFIVLKVYSKNDINFKSQVKLFFNCQLAYLKIQPRTLAIKTTDDI